MPKTTHLMICPTLPSEPIDAGPRDDLPLCFRGCDLPLEFDLLPELPFCCSDLSFDAWSSFFWSFFLSSPWSPFLSPPFSPPDWSLLPVSPPFPLFSPDP